MLVDMVAVSWIAIVGYKHNLWVSKTTILFGVDETNETLIQSLV